MTASPEVRAKVHAIMADLAMIDASDVNDHDSMMDLALDSMGLVEAIFAIEEAFDVKVPFNANAPDESAFDTSTVASIADEVQRLVDAQHG